MATCRPSRPGLQRCPRPHSIPEMCREEMARIGSGRLASATRSMRAASERSPTNHCASFRMVQSRAADGRLIDPSAHQREGGRQSGARSSPPNFKLQLGVHAGCRRFDESFERADADVFERDDEEATPYALDTERDCEGGRLFGRRTRHRLYRIGDWHEYSVRTIWK
jgi:hypothetical protein